MKLHIAILGIGLAGLLPAPGATEPSILEGAPPLVRATAPFQSDGAEILERSCTACHDLGGVDEFAAAGEESVRDLISTMISYGAVVSEDEVDVLVTHILATYGAQAEGAADAEAEEAAPAFDEEAGVALVESKCTTCHDGSVLGERGAYPPDQWVETVDRMIEYGLSLTEEEYDLILLTLGTPEGGAPAGDPTETESAEAGETGDEAPTDEAPTFDVAEAEALVTSKCTTCHDASVLGERGAYPPAEWAATVDRMIGYGLALTEDEYTTIINYLGTAPEEPEAPEGDAGTGPVADGYDAAEAEALLNTACTTCHDLSAITSAPPGSFTEAQYRETIIRMTGYGLSITDPEIDLLVRYLTETYGAQ